MSADTHGAGVGALFNPSMHRFVEQSLGNVHRPLTDRQLEDKLREQSVPLLGESNVDRLIDLCWRIDQLDDVSEVIRATVRS